MHILLSQIFTFFGVLYPTFDHKAYAFFLSCQDKFKNIYKQKNKQKATLMILGIDVCGTHTDDVLVENFELKTKVKVPTDHADIMSSLLTAAEKIIAGDKIN